MSDEAQKLLKEELYPVVWAAVTRKHDWRYVLRYAKSVNRGMIQPRLTPHVVEGIVKKLFKIRWEKTYDKKYLF